MDFVLEVLGTTKKEYLMLAREGLPHANQDFGGKVNLGSNLIGLE